MCYVLSYNIKCEYLCASVYVILFELTEAPVCMTKRHNLSLILSDLIKYILTYKIKYIHILKFLYLCASLNEKHYNCCKISD